MPRLITPVYLAKTPAELAAEFKQLTTRADVAALLDVSEKELIYVLFRKGKKYIEFDVPKKSGGARRIAAPVSSIKILQRRLSQVLQAVYVPKAPVHGFARRRSIVTNADRHVGKKVLLNLDLEDFFPSIHFGRVRGVFASYPYKLPPLVAETLAQICTYKSVLPQGAPTSPVVSNMVCSSLDSALQQLAVDCRSAYTRYADDMSFSTTRKTLPQAIVEPSEDAKGKRIVTIGAPLRKLIESNTFRINEKKVRLRTVGQRREVTGLVAHDGVNVPREYVRSIRGLLHAWEKYGGDATEARLRARHHLKHRRPGSPLLNLVHVAAGRIEFVGMVRGHSDPLYVALWNRFVALAGPPFKRRVALAQSVDYVDNALWIIESDVDWGTAFALSGYGLVTCEHCTRGPNLVAYRPRGPKYPVTIVHKDVHIDLAIVTIPEQPLTELAVGNDAAVKKGDVGHLVGFGNMTVGSHGRLLKGHITDRATVGGVQTFFSDHRAFAGNSGGPLLSSKWQVIGVLRKAASAQAPAQETECIAVSELRTVAPVAPAHHLGSGEVSPNNRFT
jgi:RNA-directed DNA polymerase